MLRGFCLPHFVCVCVIRVGWGPWHAGSICFISLSAYRIHSKKSTTLVVKVCSVLKTVDIRLTWSFSFHYMYCTSVLLYWVMNGLITRWVVLSRAGCIYFLAISYSKITNTHYWITRSISILRAFDCITKLMTSYEMIYQQASIIKIKDKKLKKARLVIFYIIHQLVI